MAETQEPGFLIDGEHYPFAESYTLGDTVLIKRLTGMTMVEFVAMLGDPAEAGDAMLGMIGAAVWRKHPEWKLDKVEQFVHRINMEKFNTVGTDEEEGEESPPVVVAEAKPEPSDTSSPASINGAVEHDSDSLDQTVTGIPA